MVELIWHANISPEGKKCAPVRLALPFQDVETVNESAANRTGAGKACAVRREGQ